MLGTGETGLWELSVGWWDPKKTGEWGPVEICGPGYERHLSRMK
jgi:hypothetical protein